MIVGSVNKHKEAVVRLAIQSTATRDFVEFDAVVDTGFNGSLTLPPNLIEELGLPWRTRGEAMLSNGARDQFDIYSALISWNGIRRNILVESANTTPLLGMALLLGFEVRIQVVTNGAVSVEQLQA